MGTHRAHLTLTHEQSQPQCTICTTNSPSAVNKATCASAKDHSLRSSMPASPGEDQLAVLTHIASPRAGSIGGRGRNSRRINRRTDVMDTISTISCTLPNTTCDSCPSGGGSGQGCRSNTSPDIRCRHPG
eukprot:scaffold6931_cov119-Isochrysis_galbana.AAC.6